MTRNTACLACQAGAAGVVNEPISIFNAPASLKTVRKRTRRWNRSRAARAIEVECQSQSNHDDGLAWPNHLIPLISLQD
jgi:hypothetical protein